MDNNSASNQNSSALVTPPQIQTQSVPVSSFSQSPGSPSANAVSLPYAGFWLRFAALIVDIFIFLNLFSIIIFLFSRIGLLGSQFRNGPLSIGLGNSTTINGSPAPANSIIEITFIAIALIYFLGTPIIFSTTLGKYILGLKIVDSNGSRIGAIKVILREIIGKPISWTILYIGFLMVAFDDKKQGLHDKLASTYVVKTSSRGKGITIAIFVAIGLMILFTVFIFITMFAVLFGIFSSIKKTSPAQGSSNYHVSYPTITPVK